MGTRPDHVIGRIDDFGNFAIVADVEVYVPVLVSACIIRWFKSRRVVSGPDMFFGGDSG